SDDVPESNYPRLGSIYQFSCTWIVPGGEDVVHVRGSADWDGTSRDDVLAALGEGREVAAQPTSFGADNFVVVEQEGKWELEGTYQLHLLSPVAPKSARTGWITLSYTYGSGFNLSQPYNGATQQMIDEARDVLSDQVAAQVLLALLEPDDS